MALDYNTIDMRYGEVATTNNSVSVAGEGAIVIATAMALDRVGWLNRSIFGGGGGGGS